MMKTHFKSALVALCSLTVLLAAGCGGGNPESTGRGAIQVAIHWPAASRVIPEDTRSIRLRAQVLEPDDGQITNEVIVDRPEGQSISNATLENVPSVKVRVIATAHSELNAGGNILAQGSVEVRVPENGSVPADIDLGGVAPAPGPQPNPTELPPFMRAGYFGTYTDPSIGSVEANAQFHRIFATGQTIFAIFQHPGFGRRLFAAEVTGFSNSGFSFDGGGGSAAVHPDGTATLTSQAADVFRFTGDGVLPR